MPLPNAFPGALNAFPHPGAGTYADDTGLYLDEVIDQLQDAAASYELQIGSTPAAATPLGYTRLHDGTSQGLLVPTSGLVAPSLLVNSNFDVWQRSTGTVTSTTTYNTLTSYAADRFFVLPGGASVTQARNTAVPNTRAQYSLLVSGAASVTTVDIGQRVRASMVIRRAFQSLVFSVNVFNNTGAAFTPNLRIGTPGAVDNFTTVTNRLDLPLQSCPNGVWNRIYAVFDPSGYTNLANGLECVLRIPTGVLVATKTAFLSQFDLRPGTHLMTYVAPDEDQELQRALPHFESFGGSTGLERFAIGHATSATAASFVLRWARKRAAPTVTVSANADLGATTANEGGIQALSAWSMAGVGLDSGAALVTVASGLVAGNASSLMANSTTNARILVNAEL